MPVNQGRPGIAESEPGSWPDSSRILPHVVTTVNGSDKVRSHFTFTNIGLTPVFSVCVEPVRHGEHTMDFETIDELRPGASLTRLAIVHPVINNDPHWTFEFWTDSGEESETPLVVRYQDEDGRPIVMRNTLRWNRRRVYLVPDRAPEPAKTENGRDA
jgi:hypothetical protein